MSLAYHENLEVMSEFHESRKWKVKRERVQKGKKKENERKWGIKTREKQNLRRIAKKKIIIDKW